MNFLKGKFLVAALALNVFGAGLYNQGVSAYKLSKDMASKGIIVFDDAMFNNNTIILELNLEGTPYKFKDSIENKRIFADSIRMEKLRGFFFGDDIDSRFYPDDEYKMTDKNISISPDGKRIFLDYDGDSNDLEEFVEEHDQNGTGDAFKFFFKEGYDFSGIEIDGSSTDEPVSAMKVRIGNLDGFYGNALLDNLYRFLKEDSVSIDRFEVFASEVSAKIGGLIDPSSFFSGLDDEYSFTWKTPVDTSLPGKKEGVVTVEYRGEVTIVVDVPVVVNVEAAPEVKNEVIDDASVPQAPNTGFQNTAGAGLIALSLFGFSTWFVVKRK